MPSSTAAESAPPRVPTNHKSGWPILTARTPTDQAWLILTRFAGPQQQACFVAGSLAFKRNRGERAIARLEHSQICMVNLDCAINHRSSLACCVKIYGPAAACVLRSWSACPQARPRESAPPRVPTNHKSGWPILTARTPTDQAWLILTRFAGPQQQACFVAGSLAFKRGRVRVIARLEQSQIWMVNLDCAINYRSSLECCVKIYGPAAACVLCSGSACPQARPRRARRRESRPITNLDGQF